MKNYFFTIFTPCYNGENTIERVFQSVDSQTYLNYEWIIINDGSKDESQKKTESLIKKYQKLSDKIIFLTQTNQGKHVAWNKAVKMAKGDFFLSADCDDSFKPNTLSFFNQKANEIASKDFLKTKYSGINVCCYNPVDNNIIGDKYPYDGLISDNIELEYKYNIYGEHWGIVRTDILKQIKFPQINGHFYNESFLWFSIGLHYKVICFNEPLRAYYYETNSLVNNKSYKLNKDRSYMELHFNWWCIKKIGPRILNYSLKRYLGLIKKVIKCVIKLTLSYIISSK